MPDQVENLKVLTIQAMVATSEELVGPSPVRDILNSIHEVSGLLPQLEDAHSGLLKIQFTDEVTPEDARVKEISKRGGVIDFGYDRSARGINMIIEGNALLLEDDANTETALQNLIAKLYPEGLSIVQRTYLEEAGETKMAAERLTDADQALLASIPTLKGNLQNAVTRWFEQGAELGALEHERALAVVAANDAEGITLADVMNARNRWIRVVRAILAALDLVEGLEPKTLSQILKPLQTAVAKAMDKASKDKVAETAPTSL